MHLKIAHTSHYTLSVFTVIVFSRCDAGSHLYKVGIDTPRSFATSRGGIPSCNSRFAAAIFESVILRLRPPVRPCRRAASSPARSSPAPSAPGWP